MDGGETGVDSDDDDEDGADLSMEGAAQAYQAALARLEGAVQSSTKGVAAGGPPAMAAVHDAMERGIAAAVNMGLAAAAVGGAGGVGAPAGSRAGAWVPAARAAAPLPSLAPSGALAPGNVARQGAAAVAAYVADPLAANTAQGAEGRARAWAMYVEACGGGEAPPWPPSKELWCAVLVHVRERVLSHTRFMSVQALICGVGVKAWAATPAARALPPGTAPPDPRRLYRAEAAAHMSFFRRDRGQQLRQVAGVSMREGKSANFFVGANDARGMMKAAAFGMGCVMGGRRSRSLASIRLAHLRFTVETCSVRGVAQRVPCLEVAFVDEKYMDSRGVRSARETYAFRAADDHDFLIMGCVYWAYRLLVLRGAFGRGADPLSTLPLLSEFRAAPEFLEEFLFCRTFGDQCIGGIPVAPKALSEWTREMLKRMGAPPRGFSAHRRGFVTRACIIGVLQAHGEALSPARLEAICACGGWQLGSGHQTVMRTYLQPVLEMFLSGATLAFGPAKNAEGMWLARLHEYLNDCVRPPAPMLIEPVRQAGGQRSCPLRIKVAALHSPEWVAYQREASAAASAVLGAGEADVEISPLNRYRHALDVMSCAGKARKPEAAHLGAVLARRAHVWKAVWQSTVDAWKAAWRHWRAACGAPTARDADMWAAIAPLDIGGLHGTTQAPANLLTPAFLLLPQ